ncbi:glycosyl hydrolase family 10 [Palleniella muris]|uniref:Glycosyl hydrolase family 10 n=1 Tax=Palleniella muris TaxID=3038145 RepID=A0AC61QML4_9BACT|nr:endo-1,4-beta-xylanase [Palleniella muris]TGX80574.1 glycosyl hydrolase family 10 [Palleniella muris]
MKKIHVLYALAAMTMMSCADDKYEVFSTANPNKGEAYEYLNGYDHLKTYVDRVKYPNFKLAGAVPASEFNQKQQVYALGVSNFDEVVTGNAFKYASVVNDKGVMNFSTVKDFTDNAVGAGLLPYGHTLVWHSQQNIKYLTGLMADKELEVDPGAGIDIEDYYLDYSALSKFPFYVMEYEPEFSDGVMHTANPGSWYQYFAGDNIPTTEGREYTVTVMAKASEDISMNVNFGNWSSANSGTLNIGTKWAEYSVKIVAPVTSCFVVFQPGTSPASVDYKWIKVTHKEAESITIPVEIFSTDFSDGKPLGGWGAGLSLSVDNGVFIIDNPTAAADWEKQVNCETGYVYENGNTYFLKMRIKGSKDGSFNAVLQNPDGYKGCGNFQPVKLTTDWQDVTVRATCNGEGATRLLFSVGAYDGKIYIDDYTVYYEKSANSIPLTPEEKKEVITGAMDEWIKGMMNATEGRVKAWDLVNEPIGGASDDGEGNYALQHADNPDDNGVKGDNFYWQDILGDIDFVVLAEKKARKYFAESGGNPDELKLFINDYNLESWWDGNKKVKSMVNWIRKWEAAGAKIDGIGTQMHVSLILDEQQQAAQEASIENMFRILAASGKLIRVSELDMGVVEKAFGTGIKTENVTEEQHMKMAAFYKWIVQKYLEIIPVEQQWGICVWGLTDSPANSGWRPGEPIGAWDLNYHRKHTYAGYADGLSGK